MFDLRNFTMRTLKGSVGNAPDWKVMKAALSYYEKEVITIDDLSELDLMIKPKEEPTETIPEDL